MTNWECAVEIARHLEMLVQVMKIIDDRLRDIEGHLDFLCGVDKK